MSARRSPFYQQVAGLTVPGCFSADAVRSAISYQPREGELFVASFPKTGTTWTQMIVFLITSRGRPPRDSSHFFQRTPFLEMYGLEALADDGTGEEPFAIKTHLPIGHAPFSVGAKYIYVTRNPKDTCVSLFHQATTVMFLFEDGDFDVFFDIFLNGKTEYGDYFDHVLGWYEHRHAPNVLFMTYEELKENTASCVLKIAEFMGEEHATAFTTDPLLMERVLKYSGVDFMKTLLNQDEYDPVEDVLKELEHLKTSKLPSGIKHVRKFVLEHRSSTSKPLNLVRKGLVGGWRQVLSREQAERLDAKIEDRLRGTELLALWKSRDCV